MSPSTNEQGLDGGPAFDWMQSFPDVSVEGNFDSQEYSVYPDWDGGLPAASVDQEQEAGGRRVKSWRRWKYTFVKSTVEWTFDEPCGNADPATEGF